MQDWKADKSKSDIYLPEIKSILGLYLIGEPPLEEDQERNTDLMVLRMEAVRIGCRVRNISYLDKYGDEFTIRAGRPSGTKTELTKIIEGWGDYFFYGFGEGARLVKWGLGDLKIFRLWFSQQLYAGKIPGIKKNNTDNSSHFLAFKWADLPKEFIVANNDKNTDPI